MIGCEEARQRWNLRLDGGGEDAELDEHLASCDACVDYARQMRAVADMLDELRVETDQIVGRRDQASTIETPGASHRLRLIVFARLMRIAAAVAVLIAGGLYLSNRFPRTGAPTGEDQVDGVVDVTPGPATMVRLVGDSAERYLAVSHPTSDANVQMVWLYPSLRAAPDESPSRAFKPIFRE